MLRDHWREQAACCGRERAHADDKEVQTKDCDQRALYGLAVLSTLSLKVLGDHGERVVGIELQEVFLI